MSGVANSSSPTFGVLLRRYRERAELSQEELAERAGLTAQGIGALERGERRHPYPATVRRLAEALGLEEGERAELLGVVRPRSQTVEATAESVTKAPLPPTAEETREAGEAFALPTPLTPLLGREGDVARVRALLSEGKRLLTLTGPGGVGKTRLALQVATESKPLFADGAVFVPLAPLAEAGLMLPALAQVLGVRESGSQPLGELLRRALQRRQMLLVLDNCEHVLAGVAEVVPLLESSPQLVVLATSRAPLRVRGEYEFPVRPLTLPTFDHRLTVEEAVGSPAVRLFVGRARAASPGFALTTENVSAVAAVCGRLDGLPLALELAAPRIKLLSPHALLGRLHHTLPLLTGGGQNVPSRQQTLHSTIAWSYGLLKEGERVLFRRLSVFAGGCTLEAAERVCTAWEGGEGEVLEGLGSLVEKSLLQAHVRDGEESETRFTMLETIREYALERLQESKEAAVLQRRHAEYYLALAEEAEPELLGAGQTTWLPRLEQETHNLRAALHWCLQTGDAARGLRLGGALWRFWYVRSHFAEGRQWLSELLALPSAGEPTLARANALNGLGNLAYSQGEYASVQGWHQECLELRRRLDDRPGIAGSLNNLALLARERGDYATASRLLEEAIALNRAQSHRAFEAIALDNLGSVRQRQGEQEAARDLYTQALALFTANGDDWGRAMALCNLAAVAHAQGDSPQARASYEESCRLRREVGDRRGLAASLAGLSAVVLGQGEVEQARGLLVESLALREAVRDPVGLLDGVEGVAMLAAALGQREEAARLAGAASALRVSLEVGKAAVPLEPPAALSEHGSGALDEGTQLSLENALRLARRILGVAG